MYTYIHTYIYTYPELSHFALYFRKCCYNCSRWIGCWSDSPWAAKYPYVHWYIYIYKNTDGYTYIRVYIKIYTDICMNKYIYIYMCMCLHVFIYSCKFIYTYWIYMYLHTNLKYNIYIIYTYKIMFSTCPCCCPLDFCPFQKSRIPRSGSFWPPFEPQIPLICKYNYQYIYVFLKDVYIFT
jgi:hypothetical protein